VAKNEGWASDDDANDLLAGIFDQTEEDAAEEQRRLDAELKAREEAERLAKEEEAERRRLAAEARVTAEMDRQDGLEKRRTLRMEALRVEDLKAKGEWVDEAAIAAQKAAEAEAALKKQQEEARLAAAAAAALHAPSPEQQAAAYAAQAQAAAPPAKSKTLGIVLGLVVLLVLGLGGALFAISQGGYEVDQTSYAKVVYQPQEQEVKLITMGFTPLPKVEKKVEKEPEPKRATTTTRRRAAPKPKAKPAKKPGLKLDLSGTDPFGDGF